MSTDDLPPIADLLVRLKAGQLLDNSEWQRLRVGAAAEVIEHLVQRAEGNQLGSAAALERLCQLTRQAPWREALSRAPWLDRLSRLLASLSGEEDQVALSLGRYARLPLMASLLRNLGPTALVVARAMLADANRAPCRGLNGCEPLLVATAGPALVAIDILSRFGDPSDAILLGRLMDDQAEDLLTRCEAAAVLCRLAPALPLDPCPLLQALVEYHWFGDFRYELCLQRLLPLGQLLVGPAVALLGHEDFAVRHRAASVLAALGEPAKAALVDVVSTTPDWRVVELAEEALARLDRQLLREARRQRRRAGRSISIARPGPREDRGLSRSDGP